MRLLDDAREAFTLGFQVTAVTIAVIALGTAVLVATLLRRAGAELEPGDGTAGLGGDSARAEAGGGAPVR
jgi:hypothetical protein